MEQERNARPKKAAQPAQDCTQPSRGAELEDAELEDAELREATHEETASQQVSSLYY